THNALIRQSPHKGVTPVHQRSPGRKLISFTPAQLQEETCSCISAHLRLCCSHSRTILQPPHRSPAVTPSGFGSPSPSVSSRSSPPSSSPAPSSPETWARR